MSRSLQDDVALITGGGGSLGSETARRLAAEGAKIAVADVREEAVAAVAEEVGGLALTLDVRSDESWAAAVAATVEHFGKLTVLVNNAGIGDAAGLNEATLELWEQTLAVNQTGIFLGMRHASHPMRDAGGGAIINISSVHGIVARPVVGGSSIAYTATKGAVRLMSKAAAVDLAPDGIRVNSIHPGYVDAPMVGVEPNPYREVARQTTPLKRFAQPTDIAAGVAFLASSDAAYITATELVIDGGYSAV